MCFALAHQILSLEDQTAIVENGKKVKIHLVPNCKVGDHVLVQANMAIEIVDKKRAKAVREAYEK